MSDAPSTVNHTARGTSSHGISLRYPMNNDSSSSSPAADRTAERRREASRMPCSALTAARMPVTIAMPSRAGRVTKSLGRRQRLIDPS